MADEGFYDVKANGVEPLANQIQSFFIEHPLTAEAGLKDVVAQWNLTDGRLSFGKSKPNSYLAAIVADYMRHCLLETRSSFSFETVMSSPSKVAFLKKAQQKGYRTYLYFVINVSRVRNRVRLGGHPVPEDKILTRYFRSLDLLMEAIQYSNRAYVFDNSGENQERLLVAEITDGKELEMKTDQMPMWFKRAVWDKIIPSDA